ncbi:MAG: hypothetical protein IKF35_07595 [Solobacterium sp.]|nr:hypothetical protein [Solobacterium sp.]
MKKLLKAGMAALLICSMGACTKKEEPAPETAEPEVQEETVEPELAGEATGAWEVYKDAFGKNLTDDDKAHFEAAMEGLTGVGYTPVAVLARQVVSGENTAYLALGTTVTETPVTDFYVVVVYNNLQGGSEILSIKKIDLTDIKVTEEAPAADLLGGWTVQGSGRPGSLTAESEAALMTALANFTGMQIMPVSLLGTQVVSGLNFRYLMTGAPITGNEEEAEKVYLAEVYMDKDGKAEMTALQPLDLLYYVTPEE